MKKAWATSGIDLHVDIAGPGIRKALEHALRTAIDAGRLGARMRLPSSRSLATDLGIARNTVADAYGQLVAEGWLTARQGSGTFVADRVHRSVSIDPEPSVVTPGIRYDLRPGAPDVTTFPRSRWLAATRTVLQEAPDEVFGYGDPRGMPQLRKALAGYLGRVRGVIAAPDQIIVCSGFTEGLNLTCDVLAGSADGRRTGRRSKPPILAAEVLGHAVHRNVVRRSGLRQMFLPVNDDGAAIDDLDDAAAVLLTPAHQFPLGVPLSPDRRRRAVRWAADTGRLVIEDDYDGEFRFDRQAIGAMQALDPDHVVYAGTASKSLAPGLRLGWLVAPPRLVDAIVETRRATGRFTAAVDQLVLAELIASGGYDRHIRRSRLAYRRRRNRLVAMVADRAPSVKVSGIAAGLHALVELAPGATEEETIARAAERGVAVTGLGSFAAAPTELPPALVVGYGTPPEHAFTAAMAHLGSAIGDDV